MKRNSVTCTICGHSFDPDENPACGACPLHQGCSLVCCPACGANNINTERSSLVRLMTGLFGEKSNGAKSLPNAKTP